MSTVPLSPRRQSFGCYLSQYGCEWNGPTSEDRGRHLVTCSLLEEVMHGLLRQKREFDRGIASVEEQIQRLQAAKLSLQEQSAENLSTYQQLEPYLKQKRMKAQ